MSQARAELLARIRAALGRGMQSAGPDQDMRRRVGSSRPIWQGSRIKRFLVSFESAGGTWAQIDTAERVPAATANYLRDRSRVRLRLSGQALLQDLRWPAGWEVAVEPQEAEAWPVAMTVAELGIAETGTLVMVSGPESPTAIHFLADDHLIVLQIADIVDYLEDLWQRLQAAGRDMPRVVNMITGPSRTADIEQTMQLGAHGPRRVHLLLLG